MAESRLQTTFPVPRIVYRYISRWVLGRIKCVPTNRYRMKEQSRERDCSAPHSCGAFTCKVHHVGTRLACPYTQFPVPRIVHRSISRWVLGRIKCVPTNRYRMKEQSRERDCGAPHSCGAFTCKVHHVGTRLACPYTQFPVPRIVYRYISRWVLGRIKCVPTNRYRMKEQSRERDCSAPHSCGAFTYKVHHVGTRLACPYTQFPVPRIVHRSISRWVLGRIKCVPTNRYRMKEQSRERDCSAPHSCGAFTCKVHHVGTRLACPYTQFPVPRIVHRSISP